MISKAAFEVPYLLQPQMCTSTKPIETSFRDMRQIQSQNVSRRNMFEPTLNPQTEVQDKQSNQSRAVPDRFYLLKSLIDIQQFDAKATKQFRTSKPRILSQV